MLRPRAAGLVNTVVPAGEAEAHALAAARRIADKPRAAMLAARRLLKGDPADILARIEAEAELFAARVASPEAQAAFAAFMEKSKR
jgi:enoyl-CoA hydratase/carnithine racemase